MAFRFFLLLALALAGWIFPATAQDDIPDIRKRLELFVDDLLVGDLDGTYLKFHQPHRLRRVSHRPFGHYATVLQEGDLYSIQFVES